MPCGLYVVMGTHLIVLTKAAFRVLFLLSIPNFTSYAIQDMSDVVYGNNPGIYALSQIPLATLWFK